jgi:hypothetical protein
MGYASGLHGGATGKTPSVRAERSRLNGEWMALDKPG